MKLTFNKSTRFRLSVYSCVFLAIFAIICVVFDMEHLATRCIEGFMLIGTTYLFGRSYTDGKYINNAAGESEHK
jgi:hypothetical protein